MNAPTVMNGFVVHFSRHLGVEVINRSEDRERAGHGIARDRKDREPNSLPRGGRRAIEVDRYGIALDPAGELDGPDRNCAFISCLAWYFL
ncbi:MAG: hypothetical protein HZA69_08035 [Gammaproteobacteria bacterium]|nr:hypothetical protein [Gammaproteobacteria bacterium]